MNIRATTQAAPRSDPSDADGEENPQPDPGQLPRSARLVFRLLAEEGPLKNGEIAELTQMPDRTVRWAITRLEDAGLVGARANLADARQRYYFVRWSASSRHG